MKFLKEKNRARERAIQNLMQLPPDDKIRTIIDVRNLQDEEFVNISLHCVVYEARNYQKNRIG